MVVNIKPANTDFVAMFESVKRGLTAVLGDLVQIHHIGSTAVPGVDGKNILDILISARDYNQMESFNRKLLNAGYFSSHNPSRYKEYLFLASRQEETGEGDIHIHIAILGTELHDNFLILRDFLRANEDEAVRYSRAKYKLSQKANHDRSLYKKYKAEYVDELLRRARAIEERQ